MRITLKDIAHQAGVSETTVSLVLNGRAQKHGISQQTQNRIKELADSLDYRPSYHARAIAAGTNNTIAFAYSPSATVRVMPSDGLLSSADIFMSALACSATIADYNLLVFADRRGVIEDKLWEAWASKRIAGIIAMGNVSITYEDRWQHTPMVLLEGKGDKRFDHIARDEESAQELAVTWALKQGVQSVLLIDRKIDDEISSRIQAIQTGLNKLGIDSHIITATANLKLSEHRQGISLKHIARQVYSVLTKQDLQFDAMIGYNDEWLIAGLQALIKLRGIEAATLPCLGFDNYHAPFSPVPYDSISFSINDIAANAVDMVIQKIDGKKSGKIVKVPARLRKYEL